MTLECINPRDLPVPETYSQVVVATGSKLNKTSKRSTNGMRR